MNPAIYRQETIATDTKKDKITWNQILLSAIIARKIVSNNVVILAHNMYAIKWFFLIAPLVYRGSNMATLTDKDILKAVIKTQAKKAEELVVICCNFLIDFLSLTKEKLLSKEISHQIRRKNHIRIQ